MSRSERSPEAYGEFGNTEDLFSQIQWTHGCRWPHLPTESIKGSLPHLPNLPFAVMYLGSRAQQSHCMCQCGSQLLDDFPFGICHRMWFPSTWLVGILVVWVAPVTHPITFPGFFLPGYEPLRKALLSFYLWSRHKSLLRSRHKS